MSALLGTSKSRRLRMSGVLNHGGRGLSIVTESGDLWVLEREEVDSEFLGCLVTVEGIQTGYDRLKVDWIGPSSL